MDYFIMVVESVSLPVKAGWVVLLAWTLLQLTWRRRARIPAFTPLPPMPPEPRRRPITPVVRRETPGTTLTPPTRPIVYGQPRSLPESQ